MPRFQTRLLVAAGAVLLLASPALAQFPSHAVHLVVSVTPGGAPDLIARALAERLSPAFGHAVVVENKPGSNGNLAAEHVARGRPDGHLLLLTQDTLVVLNPHLYARMPVDVRSELVPVAALATHDFVLALHPGVPASSLAEFLALARAARPPLAYASGGNGSQHHLAMELLKSLAGIDLLHVPYRGGAAAAAATAAGEVAATMAAPSAQPLIRAGRLREITETLPGFSASAWIGLFAPAATPEAALARWRLEIRRALADPSLRGLLERSGGLRPLELGAAEFAALIRRDDEKYRALVARLRLRLD
jgi:tripartite-type tricarboxylate transporter receptor subunit TctC